MAQQNLNTEHIRDLLDYLEAEAMTSLQERKAQGDIHQDFVNALAAFMKKYGVYVPVSVAPAGYSQARVQKIKDGYQLDWRAHQQALEAIRPLFNLMIAVAEKEPAAEVGRLMKAAFPRGAGGA